MTFWRLMSDVPGAEDRLRALLAHHVGLWDSIAEARREGRLDSRIRDHMGNDLAELATGLPELRAIACNGGASARLGIEALGAHAGLITLPSSSPACTLSYEDKLAGNGRRSVITFRPPKRLSKR